MSGIFAEVALRAVPAVPTRPLADNDPWFEYDPNQPEREPVEHQADDEQWWDTKKRERAEVVDARLRNRLLDPKKSRAVYRDIADAQTKLTPARFRTLSYQLRKADPDLANSFPSHKAAAKALGISRATYDSHLTALKAQGWVRVHEFQNSETGKQSSSGIQFCIPAGVLPLGEPWEGPARFEKHVGAVPKRARKSANAVHEKP